MKAAENLDSLVIISGMSGSGKHTAFQALEDLGYFCVDNLPISLIPRLVQMANASGGEISQLAVVVDVRLGQSISEFGQVFEDLKDAPFRSTILFIDASDEVLARRYSETRRVHPLAQSTNLLEGIRAEREQLADIRAVAEQVVDTSDFSVHDLKRFIHQRFRPAEGGGDSLRVSLVSFGYKNGLPSNADLVFDVRFLPNPHFEPQLRALTGNAPRVLRFMESHAETGETLDRIESMLEYLLPKYAREGKNYLTIAIGCTGGRHRSVMIANQLKERLKRGGRTVGVVHRDIHHHD